MATPRMSTFPRVGCSKPAIMRRVVVLPQPLGPSRAKNSPGATARLSSRTASTSLLTTAEFLADVNELDVHLAHITHPKAYSSMEGAPRFTKRAQNLLPS